MRHLDQAAPRTVIPAPGRAQTQGLYRRYAAALYGQALLILGEQDPAEQVACDVLAGESARLTLSGEDPDVVLRHLAVLVLRRCRELGSWRVQRFPATPGAVAGTSAASTLPDSLRLLRHSEREALSLVIFGHLGYRQVARELAIPPQEAAALLRASLIVLGS
jgi:hypothetical protein